MKILYGVQGTGNGHITRACAMADALSAYKELDVTWLLSGRDRKKGCGDIQDFQWREGLTFVTTGGKIDAWKTLRKNSIRQFLRDINELDLTPYDLIVSDYEPVISHAARKRGIPVIGIGHQYAFCHPIPTRVKNPLLRGLMQGFAPANTPIGLHWHHFGFPILPPIVDLHAPAILPPRISHKVVVYLPFENPEQVLKILGKHSNFEFYIYHPDMQHTDSGNLHQRPISRAGFKQDLLSSGRVITNSGFELISECLQLGIAVLSKPLHGQVEQLANAAALEQLSYADVIHDLDPKVIAGWLSADKPGVKLHYPEVADRLAAWIAGGCEESAETLAAQLWKL
ncbi:MAG: MJ1255/VC2487 family glycosyltransferase [Pseudomonadota bacterium]